ncbi:MAG: hypothetical protein U9N32_09255, partial [Spirochaetota bacterium]|nr:hypothetical protein [Spirochaetota bacterium]
ISDSGETYCYIGVVKSIDVDEDGLIELYTTYTYKGDLKIDKNSIWSDVLVEDGWTDPDTLLNNFGKMTEIEFSKKYPEYII